MKSVVFTWGTSRGRDTYGYTTCTCKVDGKRIGSVNGGGYDLKGAAFADALEKIAHDRLIELARTKAHRYNTKTKDGHYGPGRQNPDERAAHYGLSAVTDEDGNVISVHLDGACGFDSMVRVAKDLGYSLNLVDSSSLRECYAMTEAGE